MFMLTNAVVRYYLFLLVRTRELSFKMLMVVERDFRVIVRIYYLKVENINCECFSLKANIFKIF